MRLISHIFAEIDAILKSARELQHSNDVNYLHPYLRCWTL